MYICIYTYILYIYLYIYIYIYDNDNDRWPYVNERVSNNTHLIGQVPKTITSHDSFQFPKQRVGAATSQYYY